MHHVFIFALFFIFMIKSIFTSLFLLLAVSASAQSSVGDLLKGIGQGSSDIGSTIGNAIQGIFTKTDLTLDDIVGEYVSTGPAVAFKSDNFLKKAGGIAGAAALETKLQPYFEQYGMIGMPLTIDKDANFTLVIKRLKLSGTVARNEKDGTFTFNVMIAGMKIGRFTAYVQKSGRDIDLMFDAAKLKELISTVGKFTGSKLTATAAKILDSYEGATIGFKMKNTADGSSTGNTGSSTDSTSSGSPLENLRNILNRRK